MDNKKENDEIAKGISGAVAAADEAHEIDNIINDILGADGSYKPDFSEMLSKYHGDASPEISDGMSGIGRPHRDYAAEADAAMAAEKAADSRISKKVSSDVRATYSRETENALRPEFTPDGNVRYPSYGVGESEQRVVYDADWEVQAKEEAARMEKLRRGNMLRGDSDYAGKFRFSGAENRPAPKKTSYSGLIDPLSDESDPGTREIYSSDAPDKAETAEISDSGAEKNTKKSFFQEGFSVGQKTDEAVSGKTENENDGDVEEISKEISDKINNRVIEAFSVGFDANNEFKGEHWQDIVDKAQKRKEQQASDARRQEARRRSQQRLDEQKQKIARMEEDIERAPQTDMNIFSSFSERGFTSGPAENGIYDSQFSAKAEKASAYSPEKGVDPLSALPVDAERLSPDEVRSIQGSAAGADEKIKKSFGDKTRFFIKTHFSKEGVKRFAVNNLPQKDDSAGEKVRKIVRAVSFVALVCAVIYLLIYYHNYRARIKFLQESESEISELEKIPEYELDNAWAEMRAKYPDVDFPEGMNIKFANLYAISRNVVGWLKIENTDISTVLLQTNNDSYYLYRDIYGSYSRYGNPYVMASCNMGREGLSKNTVIYGHNTHDKLIFNKLENYMTVAGYLNAPIITLDTLYETTKWKIFAVMLTNADPADDNGNIFTYLYSSFPSEEAFLNKMEQIKARSMIHTGVDVQAGDKTLMLYTCYRSIFSSGRLVIVARQLREGESEEINSSLVYYDNSAIFPQAYYDKKNGTKPTEEEITSSEPEEPGTSSPSADPSENVSAEPSNDQNGETDESRDNISDIPSNPGPGETDSAPENGTSEGSQPGENTSGGESESADNNNEDAENAA